MIVEDFTQEELDEAYAVLIAHQQEFLSDSIGGKHLRKEAIKKFKEIHPKDEDLVSLAILADLDDEIEIKNACILEMQANEST